jgi:hypothetical protein
MATHDPQTRELMSRLALSCSALARAGQILSTVTDPEATSRALQQATAILEADARASSLPQIAAAARECRDADDDGDPAARVAGCRKLATRLARLASTLATEVQEQTRRIKTQPTLVALESPEVAGAGTANVPVETAMPRPPSVPEVPPAVPLPPVAMPAPPPPRPRLDVARIHIAVSAEERAAVTAAFEAGSRFAEVGNGTLIDTRLGLMWAATVGPSGSHAVAVEYAAQSRLGGYADWRLPRPEELQHFLAGSGHEVLSGGAGRPMSLWTSDTSRRWLFLRQATVVHTATGSAEEVAASRRDVGMVLIRSVPRSR